MVQLKGRKEKPAEQGEGQPSGSTFLKDARSRLSAVIGQYAVEETHEAYDTFEELFSALEEELWKTAEALLKESYANGRRGRGKRR